MVINMVGNRIRELRTRRNMTQQELADLADIPRATLATMERDDANPGLAAVYKVALALESTIDDLLEKQQNRIEFIPSDEMRQMESGDGIYMATTISPLSSPELLQQIFTLKAHSTFPGKPHPPGSEEYLHILSGEVIVKVAGEETRLRQGDSAHFRGNIKHSYSNPGNSTVRGIVTILTYPEIK